MNARFRTWMGWTILAIVLPVHGWPAPIHAQAPGPEITSRLCYLYYFRDAQHVAQILRGSSLAAGRGAGNDANEQIRRELADAVEARQGFEESLVAPRSTPSPSNRAPIAVAANLLQPAPGNASANGVESAANLSRQVTREELIRQQLFERDAARSVSENDSVFPGNPRAEDVADQVTISVVGEGAIHLNGPIKGVHRLARMIHEIDRPVGQVKIGLHSIQIDLPSDEDVERVHNLIEDDIHHARTLAIRSGELYKRSFADVTSEWAKRHRDGNGPASMYCGHFMRAVEQSAGSDAHHDAAYIVTSLDSLDLLGCLYLTALTDDAIRTQILMRFEELVLNELVEQDAQYYRRLFEEGQFDPWRKGMYRAACPECDGTLDLESIRSNSMAHLSFANIHRLLLGQMSGQSLNQVQTATLALVRTARELRAKEVELRAVKTDQLVIAQFEQLGQTSLASVPRRQAENLLLDRFIDRRESEIVDGRERLRADIATVDSHLSRMAMAVEDDLNTQYYRRAMRNIRRATEIWNVRMGQIESTTILTGDRTPARVSPGQTVQFELPERPILAKEILGNVESLAAESEGIAGRFALRTAARSLGPAGSLVTGALGTPALGDRLQSLVPAEQFYRVEAGNELHLTPIIQPDGNSIAYRLTYPYRTTVRGPIGSQQPPRVVRHFIDTEVQTSSYELREVSRFRVGVQADRPSRGVALLKDVPVVGRLFRTAGSRSSSVQETMILSDCVIYPSILSVTGMDWLDPDVLEDDAPVDRMPGEFEASVDHNVVLSARARARSILKAEETREAGGFADPDGPVEQAAWRSVDPNAEKITPSVNGTMNPK